MSAGRVFEQDAAQKLVDDLCRVRVQGADGTPLEQKGLYVEPVQLQVVCLRLWDKLPPTEKQISLGDVEQAGDTDTALAEYYESQVESAAMKTGVSERLIREWFDRKLITSNDIRGQVLMEPDDQITSVPNGTIRLLQAAYLVRAEKRGGSTWYELAHDRLVHPIRTNNKEWFDQNLSLFQRQADLWNNQNRIDGLLLRGPAYKDAEKWVEGHRDSLLPHEKEFLEECRNGFRTGQRQRFLNTLIRWLGIAAIIGGIFVYVFYRQAKETEKIALDNAERARLNQEIASRNEQIALARQLAAQSVSKLESSPAASVRDALDAVSKVLPPLPEAQDALRRALPALRVEQNLIGHSGNVYSVVFSPNGLTLVSTGSDGTLRVWDLANNKGFSSEPAKTIQVIPTDEIINHGVITATFSPDGETLAVGTEKGEIVFYDSGTWTERSRISAHELPIRGLSFSPDGRRIISASDDTTAIIWNVETRRRILTLAGHANGLNAVVYSPDGTRIATASNDRSARVWDAGNGQVLATFKGHSGVVNAVTFSHDSRRIATSSSDRTIRIWNSYSGAELLEIAGHRDWVYGLAFTADDKTIISSSADRTIRFWDTTYGRPDLVLTGHVDQVFAVALSPNGKRLASASADGNVLLWIISPDGSRELFTTHTGARAYDVDYNLDGNRIVTAGGDGEIRLWNSNGRLILILNGHTDAVESVSFSPDGNLIASAGRDATARIWDATSGAEKLVFSAHTDEILDIEFSPNSKQVATASRDGRVKVWDVKSGGVLRDMQVQDEQFVSLAFSPDGKSLVAGNIAGEVTLWNLVNGLSLGTWLVHQDAVEDLAFNAQGTLLATVGDDGIINVLDVTNNMSPKSRFTETGGTLYSVTFSPDGKSLLAGGVDGIAHIFDVEQVQSTINLYGNTDRIFGAVYSPDGSRIVTAGGDGTLRGFVTSVEELVALANERLASNITPEQCLEVSENCPQVMPLPTSTPTAVAVSAVPPEGPSLVLESEIEDPDSSTTAAQRRAPAGDDFFRNLFERPFSASAMDLYYPEVDIQHASLSLSNEWIYFTVKLKGPGVNGLDANYGVELDLNGDGRGNMLIVASAPKPNWSTGGVRVWQDTNRDIGDERPIFSDPPQLGNGYDVLVFDQGIGSSPDLAWARLSPNNPNTIQIAIRRELINNDLVFLWGVWASREAIKPAWFDYNDHFTFEEAGSPNWNSSQYPLKSLYAVDSTCRWVLGFIARGDEAGICPRPQP